MRFSFDYPKGVRFACSKCGLCCGDTQQKARHVLMLKADAERIATNTGQQINSFADQRQGREPYIYEMKKNPQDGRCLFLKDNQCTVYTVRPLICRFYPFELSTNEVGRCRFRATDECIGISQANSDNNELTEEFFAALLKIAEAELNCDNE